MALSFSSSLPGIKVCPFSHVDDEIRNGLDTIILLLFFPDPMIVTNHWTVALISVRRSEQQKEIASLKAILMAQADTLEVQETVMGEQTNQLHSQDLRMIEQDRILKEQAAKLESQDKVIQSLQEDMTSMSKLIGDTRRRQTDNDKLVASVTTAVQARPEPSMPKPPNPPKFSLQDNNASKAIGSWLLCMKMFFTTSRMDMENHKTLIEHTMLHMAPATAAQAHQILSSMVRPEEAPADWSPTWTAFTGELQLRWGGNPTQEAREKLNNLKHTGTLENYITTFERLVLECKDSPLFCVNEAQQFTMFLQGLKTEVSTFMKGNWNLELGPPPMAKVFADARQLVSVQRLLGPPESPAPTPAKKQGWKKRDPDAPSASKGKRLKSKHKGSSSKPTSKSDKGFQSKPEVTCYRCGVKGHRAPECPHRADKPNTGAPPKDKNKFKGKGKVGDDKEKSSF